MQEKYYLLADIAESISHLIKNDEIHNCIKAIRNFTKGKISKEELINSGNFKVTDRASNLIKKIIDTFSFSFIKAEHPIDKSIFKYVVNNSIQECINLRLIIIRGIKQPLGEE